MESHDHARFGGGLEVSLNVLLHRERRVGAPMLWAGDRWLHLCCCCDVQVTESDVAVADLPEALSEFSGCWMIGVGHRGGMVGEFDELDEAAGCPRPLNMTT